MKISLKSLNILMWSHSSMHAELHFFKSLNHPQTEFSFIQYSLLIFIWSFFFYQCYQISFVWKLFFNFHTLPFLSSFFFSPSPLLPLFPFYLMIWWQIFTNLWKYLNCFGGFPFFFKCNKSFDFDLSNPFWTMNQP